MLKNPNKFWYAVATLVGSTVGVGIYGIPFAFQKAGFGIGFLFLIALSGIILLTNLLYGEVVLRTHQRHQFIGYANKYLGPAAKKIALFEFLIAVYGGLIGIIVISGGFLSNILAPFLHNSPMFFSTLFVLVASLLVLLGLRTVSKFDFLMMLVFVGIVSLIGVWGAHHLVLSNYIFGMGSFWFLPFGVVLFAMNSLPGIPLVREVLVGNEGKFKKAILVGTAIPAVLYLVFAFFIVGVSGDSTTPDAISGLLSSLGPKVVFIGSLFGFLTSSTIFLNLGTALNESMREDFHFKKGWAWLLAIIPPYVLFAAGVRNFIDIIGLVGGVAVSLEAILLIFIYVKAKKSGERVPEYSIRLPGWSLYLLMGIFILGIVYTVFIK
jgi:tyrosine-specific transport protein